MNSRNSHAQVQNCGNANLAAAILSDYNYPSTKLICNEKIHRFGNRQVYWYICFENWLVVGDWSGQLPKISQPINQSQYNSLTFSQQEYLKQKALQAIEKAEEKRREDYKKIAIEAQKIWQNLSEDGKSIYLQNKGLEAINGIKFGSDYSGNFIATALTDNDGKIWSIQKIYDKPFQDGRNKSFLKGGKTKGNYSLFGDFKSAVIYICEGLATALSILLAAPNSIVVVSYFCHNLDAVAKNIKEKFSLAKIYIVADNDDKSEVQNG